MREQSPRLKVSAEGDVTLIELTDRKILDEFNISQIADQLHVVLSQPGGAKYVIDFANVSHMSSSALGMLITLSKRVREKKGQLRLCNIQPAIYEVFAITRLNEVFSIFPTRQEATDSLKGP